MTALDVALHAGDRFRLFEDDRVYTALSVCPDARDAECLYIVTSLDEPPLWVSVDDIEEIIL